MIKKEGYGEYIAWVIIYEVKHESGDRNFDTKFPKAHLTKPNKNGTGYHHYDYW